MERKKQKEEERRAREEVRAKLEQDRKERLAQQQALKATTPTSDSGIKHDHCFCTLGCIIVFAMQEFVSVSRGQQVPNHLGIERFIVISCRYFCYYSSCRVQVKLPGGGSTVFSLAASDPLSMLRTKVAEVNIIALFQALS